MRNWWFRIGLIGAIWLSWGANPSLSGWNEWKKTNDQDLQPGTNASRLALQAPAAPAPSADSPAPLIVAEAGRTGSARDNHAGNLFVGAPVDADGEHFTNLLKQPGLRIERIVSTGQASPPGFWYDQNWDEWVLVVSGSAGLQIEGTPEQTLRPGDYLFLPAHTRHRVTWTDADGPTVWLAVHVDEPAPSE